MDIYHLVGNTFRDSFQYTDPSTNLPTNGLTLANFTFELSKQETGAQSTADFTLTNTDNGKYDIVSSGSSGFAANSGVYYLTVYRPSDPAATRRYYTGTIRVNSTGTGGGSAGGAGFTATVANGRILLNGVPFQGATVRILNASNVVLQTTVSDASGLWGPVFFATNGTYTIQATTVGASIVVGTITVAGLVATGPGIDLNMVTTAATSNITFASLKAYARRQYKDRTGTKADTEVGEIVNDAIQRVAMDYRWPYLETYLNIAMNAAYSTGTIALANGSPTVTLTGGTFPAWAANGDLIVGNRIIPVSTLDSATQVTLKANWGEASIAAGSSYVLARYRYPMPADILKLDQIQWGPDFPFGTCSMSRSRLEFLRDTWQQGNGHVWGYAIANNEMMVYPYPSVDRMYSMLYYRAPAVLVNDSDKMDFDALHLALIHRAIDMQVATRGECVAGTRDECNSNYVDALETATMNDKQETDRPIGASGIIGDGYAKEPIFYNKVT